jgi:hypothetical protein
MENAIARVIAGREILVNPREVKKSGKQVQDWIGGTYEDASVVLMIGNEYFGGFSGKTDASGKSIVKIRKGLTEAKSIWGLQKVRDYVRRLEDRGFSPKAYRICVCKQINLV